MIMMMMMIRTSFGSSFGVDRITKLLGMYRKSYLIKLGLTFANEATCCLRWEDGKI